MNVFIFGDEAKPRVAYRAELCDGLQTRTSLLRALSSALRFLDYFGANWDALDECIRDLSWLPDGDVMLSHEDLPLTQDRVALLTYLSILQSAVAEWHADGTRKFLLQFPLDAEPIVRRVWSDGLRQFAKDSEQTATP